MNIPLNLKKNKIKDDSATASKKKFSSLQELTCLFENSEIKDFKRDNNYQISFGKSLMSHNIAINQFTNYLDCNTCSEFKILKNIYSDYKKGIDIINKYFCFDERCNFDGGNQAKKDRLKAIPEHSEKQKFENIDILDKGIYANQNKHNCPLRIVIKRFNNYIYIYLIDIYHLAWTSSDFPEHITYQEHKNKNLNLSEIID